MTGSLPLGPTHAHTGRPDFSDSKRADGSPEREFQLDGRIRRDRSHGVDDLQAMATQREAIFATYEPLKTPGLRTRSGIEIDHVRAFSAFVTDETYREMAHEAGLLGVPAKATLAVLSIRRKAGAETIASPQTRAKRPTPILNALRAFACLRGTSLSFADNSLYRGAEIRTRDLTDPNRSSGDGIRHENSCKSVVCCAGCLLLGS
jgi:hypothetical protein